MYSFDSRVRYSEIGEDGMLTLNAMINYLQDCSTFQSEDIGKGIEYLRERGCVWLLNSWQIQIGRRPRLTEQIRIGTWSYGYKSMYGYRNFVIDDMEGNHLVKANSIWVLYDLLKKRPMKITDEDLEGYITKEKLDMNYLERKILMPEKREKVDVFPVRRYQIDTNGHVNNGQYIRVAVECIPQNFEVAGLCAEYRKSAVYGDVFYPEVARTGEGYVVSLNDEAGKAFAVIALNGRA